MSVHYKFKSALSYDTITFDGLHISVKELKKLILHQKQIGKTTDFDLQIINAQTDEVYDNENTLIPKNSSLIVSRVPLTIQQKKAWERAEANQPQLPLMKGQPQDAQPNRMVKGSNLATLNASEEDKIHVMMTQSTHEYDPSNYMRIRGQNQMGDVPASYTCHRCNRQGHWIHECPSTDVNRDVRKSTGIPLSFMVPVADPTLPGAMITPAGHFAVPALDHEAYKEVKKERPPFQPEPEKAVVEKPNIPEDLVCSACHDLLTDAVMIPCCGDSFCDDCIRNILLESEDHECPDCKEKDISPETLIPNRFLRTAVNNFRNQTGYNRQRPIQPTKTAAPVQTEERPVERPPSPSKEEETPAPENDEATPMSTSVVHPPGTDSSIRPPGQDSPPPDTGMIMPPVHQPPPPIMNPPPPGEFGPMPPGMGYGQPMPPMDPSASNWNVNGPPPGYSLPIIPMQYGPGPPRPGMPMYYDKGMRMPGYRSMHPRGRSGKPSSFSNYRYPTPRGVVLKENEDPLAAFERHLAEKDARDKKRKHHRKRSRSRSYSRSPVRHKKSRSPRKGSRSPRKSSVSPRKKSRSPRKKSRSPRKKSRSPRKNSRSPRKMSRSPRKISLSPREVRKGSLSPRGSLPPRKKSLSPRMSRSPRKLSRSPRKLSRSPRKLSRSPRKSSLSPRKRSLSPRKVSRSPRKLSRSPRKSSLPPRKRTLSPRKSPIPPRKISRSPRKSRSPRRISRSPRKASRSPKKSRSVSRKLSPKKKSPIRKRTRSPISRRSRSRSFERRRSRSRSYSFSLSRSRSRSPTSRKYSPRPLKPKRENSLSPYSLRHKAQSYRDRSPPPYNDSFNDPPYGRDKSFRNSHFRGNFNRGTRSGRHTRTGNQFQQSSSYYQNNTIPEENQSRYGDRTRGGNYSHSDTLNYSNSRRFNDTIRPPGESGDYYGRDPGFDDNPRSPRRSKEQIKEPVQRMEHRQDRNDHRGNRNSEWSTREVEADFRDRPSDYEGKVYSRKSASPVHKHSRGRHGRDFVEDNDYKNVQVYSASRYPPDNRGVNINHSVLVDVKREPSADKDYEKEKRSKDREKEREKEKEREREQREKEKEKKKEKDKEKDKEKERKEKPIDAVNVPVENDDTAVAPVMAEDQLDEETQNLGKAEESFNNEMAISETEPVPNTENTSSTEGEDLNKTDENVLLAEVPEKSKWELDEDLPITEDKMSVTQEIDENTQGEDSKAITSEVLMRAENVIFQRGDSNAIRSSGAPSSGSSSKKSSPDTVKVPKEEQVTKTKEEPVLKKKEEPIVKKKEEPVPKKKEELAPKKKDEAAPKKKEEAIPKKREEAIPKKKEELVVKKKEEAVIKKEKVKEEPLVRKEEGELKLSKQVKAVSLPGEKTRSSRETKKTGPSFNVTLPAKSPVKEVKIVHIEPEHRISAKDRLGPKTDGSDESLRAAKHQKTWGSDRKYLEQRIVIHSDHSGPFLDKLPQLEKKVHHHHSHDRKKIKDRSKSKSPSRHKLKKEKKLAREEAKKQKHAAKEAGSRELHKELSNPKIEVDRKKSITIDESTFEPDYDALSHSESELEVPGEERLLIHEPMIINESAEEAEEVILKKRSRSKSDDVREAQSKRVKVIEVVKAASSASSDSESSSSSESSEEEKEKKKKKKKKSKKKRKHKKRKVEVSSDSDDSDDSSDESLVETKKKHKKNKKKTHKKKSKKKKAKK